MKQIQKDKHHDDTQSRQEVFLKRVVKLYDVMKEIGNPFEEYLSDLVVLGTKDIGNPSKGEYLNTLHVEKNSVQLSKQDWRKAIEHASMIPLKRTGWISSQANRNPANPKKS